MEFISNTSANKLCFNETGKTVLASMIIEEVKKRQTLADPGPFHSTTTALSVQYAYFYCKYEDAEKNNFLAIMRALIAQLALQNRDSELSLLLYEMIIQSEDARLSSRSEAIKLLNCVLEGSSATHTYFIVDGLDECATSETIINIIDTLNKIIEPLNRGSPGAFRLFYTSRDENIIRKQFSKAIKLKIKPADNEQDIKHYATHWSSKIQNKFELSNDERQDLESNIMSKANGIYTRSDKQKIIEEHAKVTDILLSRNVSILCPFASKPARTMYKKALLSRDGSGYISQDPYRHVRLNFLIWAVNIHESFYIYPTSRSGL